MAYKSTQEFVDSMKAQEKEDTAARKERADELVEQKKEAIGYKDMSDEQKKVADKDLNNYHDHLMGKHNPDEDKKESTEEDDHDDREIER